MTKKIVINAYCGYFIGPMKWQGTEHYEPDECETEFEFEATQEEWDAGEVMYECPNCKNILYQEDDHFALKDVE